MKCNRCGKDNPAEIHTCSPNAPMTHEQAKYVQSALNAIKQYGNIFRYERHQVNPYEKVIDALDIMNKFIKENFEGK